MRPYSCGNPSKRVFCTRECETCLPRTFARVEIEIAGEEERQTIIPAEYWHLPSNDGILPSQVARTSNRIFFFLCTCLHIFGTRLIDCTNKHQWCPFCAGKRFCGDEECTMCFDRSFLSIERDWGRPGDYILDVDPLTISKYSHKKCSFSCIECNHVFTTALYSFMRSDWPCSYCNGDILCENAHGPDLCNFCYEKSYGSHKKSNCWSKKNTLTPFQVRKHSNKKFWFDCDTPGCNHDFEAGLDNIVDGGTWCPYCSIPAKRLCDKRDCEQCFNTSLASFVKVAQLVSDVDPRQIIKGGHTKKLRWVCEKPECAEEFDMYPNNAAYGGQWCPNCKKKTELKLYKWLVNRYGKTIEIVREWKTDLCINEESGRHLPFDFYIPELSVILEVDGPQHFVQISNWQSPVDTQKMDEYKENVAIEQKLSVIRLLQTDIFYDDNNWEELLTSTLDDLPGEDETPIVVQIYGGYVHQKI